MLHGRGENRTILRRREQDDYRRDLAATLAKEQKAVHVADWEQKTSDIITKNAIHNIAHGIQQQHRATVEQRRRRLAEMLAEEDAIYRQEIAASQETSADKARRLIVHARELKAQREAKRQQYVQQAYQRQWKDSCDDLRTIDSTYYRHHCNDEVIKQMNEKLTMKEMNQEEEAKWAELWEQERLKKVQQEDERARQAKLSIIENRAALTHQVQEKRHEQAVLQAKTAKEKAEFQHQMAMDAAASRKKQLEEYENKRQLQKQTVEFNEQLKKARKAQKEAEREEERRILGVKMAEFRADTEARANDQEAQRRDIHAYRSYLAARRAEEARMESEMERLIQEDLDRSNAKRDMQWEKERLAREKLMADVYQQRLHQIANKEQEKLRLEEQMIYEREAMDLELQRVKQEEEREAREEALAAERRRFELESQIEINRNRKQLEQQRITNEKYAAEEAEREYRDFVQRSKQTTHETARRNYGIKGTFNHDLHNTRAR